jgi:gamma-glutamyltranspeptidase/glutathione hydrolase
MPRVAIAAPSAAAAEAATQVVEAGGGAVDAAIACAIASMVTEPGVVAPGAGAFVSVLDERGAFVHDGYMAVPGLDGRHPHPVDSEVSMEYGGGITTVVGPASIAVPGAWAAFGDAHRMHGSVPWAEVLAPAIELARTGSPLGATSAHYLDYSLGPVFGKDPAGAAALAPDGSRLSVGDLVRVEGLADSLTRLAEHGTDDLYRGELARRIALDLRERGSHVGVEDLHAFEVCRRDPLGFSLGEWQLATNPPPAVGGAALAAVLALAPGGDVLGLIEAQMAVFGWRRRGADESPDRRSEISAFLRSLGSDPLRSPSTAHVSTAGGGVACAITLSAGYGSGVIPTGTGMWMNNGLGEIELVGDRHRLRPGDRLNSNMAPTVGRHRDGRLLAIGSPGADRITSAIAQTLLGLQAGLSAEEAIAAPRVHVDVTEHAATVAAEPGVEIPGTVGPARIYDAKHMYFGGVGLAVAHPDGSVVAATDPRRNGVAVVQ